MKKIIITSTLMIIVVYGFGQQLFEDGSGESSIFLSNSPYGWIRLNTSSSSVAFGWNRFRRSGVDFSSGIFNNTSLLYGLDLKLKAKDGLANLIKASEFTPGLALNGNLGLYSYDRLDKKNSFISAYLRFGLNYNEYLTVDISNVTAPVTTSEKKTYGQLLFNINIQKKLTGFDETGITVNKTYWFGGISSGFRRSNNFTDLKEYQVQTITAANSVTVISKVTNGRSGTLQDFQVVPLNIDLAVTPTILQQRVLGFNTYYRTEFNRNPNISNLGVGIYLSKANQPSNVIGGLAWQFNDLENNLDSDKTSVQRSIVFFYLGYSILGN